MNFFKKLDKAMKIVLVSGAVILSGLAIILLANTIVWKYVEETGTNHADVKREIFESTKSYNDGMAQQLSRYWFEYQKADEVQQMSIRSVIRMQYANFDLDRLNNSELAEWAKNVLGGKE